MNNWQDARINKTILVNSLFLCRGQCVTVYLNFGTRENPIQQAVELRIHESGKPEIFCDLSKVPVRDWNDWENDMELEKKEL